MSTNGKIRIGILGTSRIAQKSVVPAIQASEEVVLAMIGSRSADRAREYAHACGCDSYGTYDDVLANPNIDAVYISLPNSLHEEWSLKAARAGKHVWCEKPAAITYDSAKRMVDVCKQNGVRLMEGFMFLYHPQHAKVLEMIKNGELGELQSFSGAFVFPKPAPENIRLSRELGGGIFADAGTYPIRASRLIFGDEPESISGKFVMDEKTGVDIRADMVLTYPGSLTASVHAAFGDEYQSTYEIIGSDARLWMERAYAVPPDRTVHIYIEKAGETREITIDPADQFKLMIDDFCREIRLGSQSTKKYEEDLLQQAHILEAAQTAHREGRAVPIAL